MSEQEKSLDSILGEEFLTWLWYQSDTAPGSFITPKGEPFNIYMEQRIVVQGGAGENKETATVSGSLSPLREARFGLATGKKVTRAVIRLEKDDFTWQFSLRAEDFAIGSLKTPKIDNTDKDDDADALLLEKIYLLELAMTLFDSIYSSFLKLRLSPAWDKEVREMAQWLSRTE